MGSSTRYAKLTASPCFALSAQGVFVRVAMGGKRKKEQGNSAVGEKIIDSSSSESSRDEEHAMIRTAGGTTDADRPQGDTGATETVPRDDGTKETKPMSEKQRKKKEAIATKAKRDAMVNQATKGVQDVLGDIADFFECMAKWVRRCGGGRACRSVLPPPRPPAPCPRRLHTRATGRSYRSPAPSSCPSCLPRRLCPRGSGCAAPRLASALASLASR